MCPRVRADVDCVDETGPRVSRGARHVVAASVLAAVLAAQAGWFAATTSGTYDETRYLELGREAYSGQFDGFAKDGVAPLPVLLGYALPVLSGEHEYARAILLARISAIALIGVPLVVIAYASLLRASGEAAALAGTALLVLSPNIVANAALAATDIGFIAGALAALGALVTYLERRSRGALAALAVSLGVALAAKYSTLSLFPVVALTLFVSERGVRERSHRGLVRRAAAAAAVTIGLFAFALLVVWAAHGFAMATIELPRLGSVRLPAAVAGVMTQLVHQRGGHPGFLLGQRSALGWWYFMPVAMALKSTPAELFVIGAALLLLATTWRHLPPHHLVWRITIACFGIVMLVNRLALGVRYGLLLIPLCMFVTADAWFRRPHGRGARPAAAVVVALQLISSVAIAPHYLSYVNRLAGGPEAGYRHLADSNVDWGQELPALRAELARLGSTRPWLAYFGTAPIDAYGVSADVWDGGVRRDFERWDWVAISVTNLDGVYQPTDPYADFRRLQPGGRAAYSILLYPTNRADVRAAMATAAVRLR